MKSVSTLVLKSDFLYQTGIMDNNGFSICYPIFADKNECDAQNICLYGGSCVDTPGSYFCMCVEGRTGKNCEHGN